MILRPGISIFYAHASINPLIYLSIDPSIYPSVHLSICASVHLYIHLSIYPPIHFPIYLPIYPSTFLSIYPSIHPPIHLPVYLSSHLPIDPSIHLSTYLVSYLSICLYTYLSIYPSIHLSIHLSIFLSTYLPILLSNRSVYLPRTSLYQSHWSMTLAWSWYATCRLRLHDCTLQIPVPVQFLYRIRIRDVSQRLQIPYPGKGKGCEIQQKYTITQSLRIKWHIYISFNVSQQVDVIPALNHSQPLTSWVSSMLFCWIQWTSDQASKPQHQSLLQWSCLSLWNAIDHNCASAPFKKQTSSCQTSRSHPGNTLQ